jgi:hypothetical protein
MTRFVSPIGSQAALWLDRTQGHFIGHVMEDSRRPGLVGLDEDEALTLKQRPRQPHGLAHFATRPLCELPGGNSINP